MNVLLLGPDWRNATVKAFLEGLGCRVVMYTDPVTLAFCEQLSVAWIISNGYAPIIKEPVISAYRRRIVNLHPAYLPYGRGIYPNLWGLFEGRATGVSIHFIDAGIDTGDVIARESVEPLAGETLQTFYDRLLERTDQLFRQVWPALIRGEAPASPQEDAVVLYRNRLAGERLMDLFPSRWRSSTTEVEAAGADFWLGQQFWAAHADDARGMQ